MKLKLEREFWNEDKLLYITQLNESVHESVIKYRKTEQVKYP